LLANGHLPSVDLAKGFHAVVTEATGGEVSVRRDRRRYAPVAIGHGRLPRSAHQRRPRDWRHSWAGSSSGVAVRWPAR